MDTTDFPEYLLMFTNTGEYTAKVKFKTKKCKYSRTTCACSRNYQINIP